METSEWSNFFFQWAATLFWIFFLTGMTGSIIANLWRFARKRYDLYENASLACFDQFLCPGDFSVLAAKRRQTCISI